MITRFIATWWRRSAARPTSAIEKADPTAAWVEAWLALPRPRAYYFPSDAQVATLAAVAPDLSAQTIAVAERLLAHEFNVLGSGWFRPVDADRHPHGGFVPIDWRLDPVSGLRFPPADFSHQAWSPERRPGTADIKLPWEFARAQHLITLGQAWKLSGDPRFAVEVLDQIEDFVRANPTGLGIHWVCTMDVALRAVSWALALDLILDAPAPVERFSSAFTVLAEHGEFIRTNLENHYEVTSNHFLSNLVGLYFLGWRFEGTRIGDEWLCFATRGLEHEVDVQINPDGSDFESSIPYHRLVTELLLGCVVLGWRRNRPLADRVRSRLHDMVHYLDSVLRPDGLMPVVGDADDGRLQIATGYGTWQPQDARSVLAVAGAYFARDDWKARAGPAARWEAGWWGFDVDSWPDRAPEAPPGAHFPDAGITVFRCAGHYLLVTNGVVGTRGFGNHKHNDLLAFEYHRDGAPVLVDPGSGVYTGDPARRNHFRSVAVHNTLIVDETEQNDFKPEWLFRMFEKAFPTTLLADAAGLRFIGQHSGYARLPDPVTHARAFCVDAPLDALLVADRLIGAGRHRCRWHFHFAPGARVSATPGRIDVVTGEGVAVTVLVAPLEVRVMPGLVSPSYGVVRDCTTVDLEADVVLDATSRWSFAVVSTASLRDGRFRQSIDEALGRLQAGLP